MPKEMYVALVMKEGMQGVEGAYPDLIFIEAESKTEAVKGIASHVPDHPRWQKKSVIRIVMIDTYQSYLQTKLIGERKRIVRVAKKRRRRLT